MRGSGSDDHNTSLVNNVNVIYFCAVRWKVMASMTIASSPNYLLVRVHRCDDHVSSYHVYCIVILVFIYVIHCIIICCIVGSFPPSILIIGRLLDFLLSLSPL